MTVTDLAKKIEKGLKFPNVSSLLLTPRLSLSLVKVYDKTIATKKKKKNLF